MDLNKAIELAGGGATVANACTNFGMPVSRQGVYAWMAKNGLPGSEWKGSTRYAQVICDLIKTMGHEEVQPIELCPGAGQYMSQSDEGEA